MESQLTGYLNLHHASPEHSSHVNSVSQDFSCHISQSTIVFLIRILPLLIVTGQVLEHARLHNFQKLHKLKKGILFYVAFDFELYSQSKHAAASSSSSKQQARSSSTQQQQAAAAAAASSKQQQQQQAAASSSKQQPAASSTSSSKQQHFSSPPSQGYDPQAYKYKFGKNHGRSGCQDSIYIQ